MPVNKRNFKSLVFSALLLALFLLSACNSRDADVASPSTVPAVAQESPAPDNDTRPVILAFGDSLTEGYGLAKSESYPSLLQKRLDERGYQYRVVNAGISGDTSAGGASRIDNALKNFPVEIMILELGANDMLRGQDLRNTRDNLSRIIKKAQARKITVVLAGMEAPTNLGEDYQRDFHNLFQSLADEYKLKLIPFFLDNVAGKRELNQRDGIHPNVNGTAIVLDNVWQALEPLLKK